MVKTEEVIERNLSFDSVDDRDILFMIKAIRDGIDYSLFESIVNSSPFSSEEWPQYLNLSERTLQRYKKERKAFQGTHAERILEIMLLYKYGTEVFEDNDHFNVWLDTRSVALGGIKPKELLDTSFGIGLLRDELTRIEHGVLA